MTSRSRARAIAKEEVMRPVLLWLLGVPIPIILLLYVFHVVWGRLPPAVRTLILRHGRRPVGRPRWPSDGAPAVQLLARCSDRVTGAERARDEHSRHTAGQRPAAVFAL